MPPGAGHFKTVEAAPRQGFGGSEGLGARSPAGIILKSRGASTKMRAPPRVSLGDPRTPQGSPLARPFLKRKVRESPSDPLAAHRCLGGTGERGPGRIK